MKHLLPALLILPVNLTAAAPPPTVECRLGKLLTVRNEFTSNGVNEHGDAVAENAHYRIRLLAFREHGKLWVEVVLEDRATQRPVFRNSWNGARLANLGWATLALDSQLVSLGCRVSP